MHVFYVLSGGVRPRSQSRTSSPSPVTSERPLRVLALWDTEWCWGALAKRGCTMGTQADWGWKASVKWGSTTFALPFLCSVALSSCLLIPNSTHQPSSSTQPGSQVSFPSKSLISGLMLPFHCDCDPGVCRCGKDLCGELLGHLRSLEQDLGSQLSWCTPSTSRKHRHWVPWEKPQKHMWYGYTFDTTQTYCH